MVRESSFLTLSYTFFVHRSDLVLWFFKKSFTFILQENGGGNLEAQIELFLNVEKQMRQAGDVAGTRKAVTDILQLCFEAGAWKTLNEQIVLISKRRGQLKQV